MAVSRAVLWVWNMGEMLVVWMVAPMDKMRAVL